MDIWIAEGHWLSKKILVGGLVGESLYLHEKDSISFILSYLAFIDNTKKTQAYTASCPIEICVATQHVRISQFAFCTKTMVLADGMVHLGGHEGNTVAGASFPQTTNRGNS